MVRTELEGRGDPEERERVVTDERRRVRHDGRIRRVYQIFYQVIKCKQSIVSTRIFVSYKQFVLLILLAI